MSTKWLRSSGIGVLAVLLLTGTGFAETYSIDAVHSSVGFTVRHIFSRVSGEFTDFSGAIMYNPDHPEKSSVEATIKVASINTNDGRRDNHLRSPDFFDAEKYPEIMFKSTGAKKQGDNLMVTGDLTMHGVTKTVVMPVEILGVGTHPMSKAPVAGFAAELTLKRSDFGVNNWTDTAKIVGDEVKVSINVEAAGMSMAANPCNPCGKNPCGKNPCNPCGKNPCGKNPCNPCAK